MSAAEREDRAESVRLIRDSAAAIAPPGGDTSRIRALRFQSAGFDRAVWSIMCEMGWPGLLVAEEDGGSALGCVEMALAYAKERKQFGRAIGTFQAIAHMLADMMTEVEAARALIYRCASMLDQGQDALREISMAKLKASEVYAQVANQGMQIFGGYGYNKEFDMERHYRDARVATVAAGSSQMQRNLIANLLGLKAQ